MSCQMIRRDRRRLVHLNPRLRFLPYRVCVRALILFQPATAARVLGSPSRLRATASAYGISMLSASPPMATITDVSRADRATLRTCGNGPAAKTVVVVAPAVAHKPCGEASGALADFTVVIQAGEACGCDLAAATSTRPETAVNKRAVLLALGFAEARPVHVDRVPGVSVANVDGRGECVRHSHPTGVSFGLGHGVKADPRLWERREWPDCPTGEQLTTTASRAVRPAVAGLGNCVSNPERDRCTPRLRLHSTAAMVLLASHEVRS